MYLNGLRQTPTVDYTEQEGGKTEVGVYRLTLIPVSRETFDLKAAWDVIGEKTLKPFVKLVEYPRLQVKRQVV